MHYDCRRYFLTLVLLLLTAAPDLTACNNACEPGTFDVRVQGGMAHIMWKGRGEIDSILCPVQPPLRPLNKDIDIPDFRCFYNVPWTVGGQIGYSYTDHVRWFLECTYLEACPKNRDETKFLLLASSGAPAGSTINFRTSRYRLYDVSLGTQYYFTRLCNIFSPFLGIKVGITGHQCTRFSLAGMFGSFELIIVPPSAPLPLFKRKVSPTAGVQFGFDVYLSECLNFALTGEVVGTCGPKTNRNIVPTLNIDIPVTNVIITHICTELRFPVTASLRYNF